MENKNSDTENRIELENSRITKSASRVMMGGIFSLLAGLISQVVVAYIFGAGEGMDAYLTALVVPAYIQYVLLTGLSVVFVPAFVRQESRGHEDEAWALAGTIFWVTTVVLTVIAVLGSIFSAQIISLSAPGFGAEKSALAAQMLSVLMLTIPFAGLGDITTSIQNARNRFFWPSFGGAINSLANAAVIVLLWKPLGPISLAWGFFASIVAQAAITIIPVIRHGWKRLLPLSDPSVREMGKLIIPILLFGLVSRSTSMFERYFASGLPNGQISYIGYAQKISNIFVTLLATGISTAIFPSMARAYAQNGSHGLEEKTNYGLRLTFSVGLPAVLITSAIAVPMIQLIYQRGAFVYADTLGVSQIVLAVLLADVLFRMVSNIFGRTSYVLKDTVTPPMISSMTTILYIATGYFFVAQWGYTGLVWAKTIQSGLGIACLWILVLRKFPNFQLKATIWHILEYGFAAFVAYLGSSLTVAQLSSVPTLFRLTFGGMAGVSLYALFLYWRDREMLKAILQITGVEQAFLFVFNGKRQQEQKSLKV